MLLQMRIPGVYEWIKKGSGMFSESEKGNIATESPEKKS